MEKGGGVAHSPRFVVSCVGEKGKGREVGRKEVLVLVRWLLVRVASSRVCIVLSGAEDWRLAAPLENIVLVFRYL